MRRIWGKMLNMTLKIKTFKIILSRFRMVKTAKTNCRHHCQEKELIYWPLTLDRPFTITPFGAIFPKPASNDQPWKPHFIKSVWCNKQHTSVWGEALSGEITESVSRCNHSVQLRVCELLKDAEVDGFGVTRGINGNSPQIGEIILFCLFSKQPVCWRRLSFLKGR